MVCRQAGFFQCSSPGMQPALCAHLAFASDRLKYAKNYACSAGQLLEAHYLANITACKTQGFQIQPAPCASHWLLQACIMLIKEQTHCYFSSFLFVTTLNISKLKNSLYKVVNILVAVSRLGCMAGLVGTSIMRHFVVYALYAYGTWPSLSLYKWVMNLSLFTC